MRTGEPAPRFQRAAVWCEAAAKTRSYPLGAAHRRNSRLCRVRPIKRKLSAGESRNKSGTAEVYYAFVSYWRQRRFYFIGHLSKIFYDGTAALSPQYCVLKPLKYTKYSCRFQNLSCCKISLCPYEKSFLEIPCYLLLDYSDYQMEVIFQWNTKTPSSPRRRTSP